MGVPRRHCHDVTAENVAAVFARTIRPIPTLATNTCRLDSCQPDDYLGISFLRTGSNLVRAYDRFDGPNTRILRGARFSLPVQEMLVAAQ
jgi:hypothetical protein